MRGDGAWGQENREKRTDVRSDAGPSRPAEEDISVRSTLSQNRIRLIAALIGLAIVAAACTEPAGGRSAAPATAIPAPAGGY